MKRSEDSSVVPFLRWAGGKRKLVGILKRYLPSDIESYRYVEPFLGAASLFFSIQPREALLSDANHFLIAAYQEIKDRPELVRRHLRKHIADHNFEHYYRTRDQFNKDVHSAAQAARFIYLNKACFNGIFRVNMKGKFNVPKGSKDILAMPTLEEFEGIATSLAGASLRALDFQEALKDVGEGDFVYLDPPYPALNETAYFAHYTSDRFDAKAQAKLASCVQAIHERGARFMMSNADVSSVKELYVQFNAVQIPVQRFVTCKKKKTAVSELIITNY